VQRARSSLLTLTLAAIPIAACPAPQPVGRTVEVSYFDQNEAFSAQLPRDGNVLDRLTAGGVDDWFLVRLHRPVAWEGTSYSHVLIRSRWEGYELSESEKVSVFILLVPDDRLPGGGQFEVDDYVHVAWGYARIRRP
jgi:hypothetical protein